MSHSTTASDGWPRLQALHDHQLRQERERRTARDRRQLLAASGIDTEKLSEQGRRIFHWLTDDWDEWTIGGIVEILTAAHAAGWLALSATAARTEAKASARPKLASRAKREASR